MCVPLQGDELKTRKDVFDIFLTSKSNIFSFVKESWSVHIESQHKEHIGQLCRGCNGDTEIDPWSSG